MLRSTTKAAKTRAPSSEALKSTEFGIIGAAVGTAILLIILFVVYTVKRNQERQGGYEMNVNGLPMPEQRERHPFSITPQLWDASPVFGKSGGDVEESQIM